MQIKRSGSKDSADLARASRTGQMYLIGVFRLKIPTNTWKHIWGIFKRIKNTLGKHPNGGGKALDNSMGSKEQQREINNKYNCRPILRKVLLNLKIISHTHTYTHEGVVYLSHPNQGEVGFDFVFNFSSSFSSTLVWPTRGGDNNAQTAQPKPQNNNSTMIILSERQNKNINLKKYAI